MFNRPFDDQRHIRIRLETEAKLYIQDKVKKNELELIWSYILDFENSQNPHDERRMAIEKWKSLASIDVIETVKIIENAKKLSQYGVKAKDALHVASAICGKATYFFTTDDKLLSSVKKSKMMNALNPIDYIKELDK